MTTISLFIILEEAACVFLFTLLHSGIHRLISDQLQKLQYLFVKTEMRP